MSGRRIRFEVKGQPCGSRYCGKLRTAIRELGFATGRDPLVEGSDNAGFLVAVDSPTLVAGKTVLRRQIGGQKSTDRILADMRDIGVYEIFQAAREEPDWRSDTAILKKLGARLWLVSESIDEERLTFEIVRIPGPSRRRSRGNIIGKRLPMRHHESR